MAKRMRRGGHSREGAMLPAPSSLGSWWWCTEAKGLISMNAHVRLNPKGLLPLTSEEEAGLQTDSNVDKEGRGCSSCSQLPPFWQKS